MEDLKPKYKGQMVISWENFGEMCIDLVRQISKEYQPDMVVGIVKAGVVPGVVMASMFRKDFYTIKLSRRQDDRVIHARPILFVPINDSVYGKKVLVVDEISLTGETLRMAKEEILGKQASEVRTATMFVHSHSYKPDWFALESDAFIVNPWDHYIIDANNEIQVHPDYLKR